MASSTIPGDLVSFPAKGLKRPLDGFLAHGKRRSKRLLLFIHGMGGNYFRSPFKKEIMRQGVAQGYDVLSFNNRGAEQDVAYEKFADCIHDIDAALDFGRQQDYRQFILLGHSTGCQKITYYQALRKNPRVKALVLTAIGDDYAICRRDTGKQYRHWLNHARKLVKKGKGDTLLPPICLGFSAKRFLSIADPNQIEAKLFNFDGPMSHFQKIHAPVLVVLPAEEEFACMPVPHMAEKLKQTARTRRFEAIIIPKADHGFRGQEKKAATKIFDRLNA